MLEVGDVVSFRNSVLEAKKIGVITGFNGDFAYILDGEGATHYIYIGSLEHAGRTIDISKILEQLK